MITNKLNTYISNIISNEIKQDFEDFIKSTNVYKNWFRTIHPNTMFGKLSIKIPRTRWKKSDNTTMFLILTIFLFFKLLIISLLEI